MLLNYGVGEDSWESLGLKGDQPMNSKGNQPWIVIGKTDAEAEAPILWLPDVKRWLIRKDPDAGKDWRQEERDSWGWDGWVASLTWWAWVWPSSGKWWWTGKPGVLQSMGSQSWTRLSDGTTTTSSNIRQKAIIILLFSFRIFQIFLWIQIHKST